MDNYSVSSKFYFTKLTIQLLTEFLHLELSTLALKLYDNKNNQIK